MPRTRDRAEAEVRAEGALWREAMRDVRPLRPRAAPRTPVAIAIAPSVAAAAVPKAAPLPAAPVRPSAAPARARALPPLDREAGIDRATAERLRRGRHPIEARLDLHGMTQAEAHRALAAFLEGARARGRRCVLVITGRGLGSPGGGSLKREVPRWLEEAGLRPLLLATAPARPEHGGAGALYLLLRRIRPPAS
jgi:DNA-nicking Smr family endonuclease